ncbi:MAG: type II toxin-antitoxin system VapC family toxin [Nitrospirae bacterium]|nr:type II toxin-antitoxin system VapC family toxin [Nitrospirota bacterium]
MIIIDSSGWIEYFTDGPLKKRYDKHIADASVIVVPTIVIYEVYRKIRRDSSEKSAVRAARSLTDHTVVPLTETIALTAAELGLEHSLHLADSIIYATAFEHGCRLVTSDAHFEGLGNVVYIRKA